MKRTTLFIGFFAAVLLVAAQFSIADNKTAEIADWDFPKLRGLIKEIQNEDLNLQDLGFSDSELRRILLQQGTDENEIPKNFSDFKTKKGDLSYFFTQKSYHRLFRTHL